MASDFVKNNRWEAWMTLRRVTDDHRSKDVFTEADAAEVGTPVLFVSMTDDTDTTLGDSNSPAWGEIDVEAIDGALDGAWKCTMAQAEVTEANFTDFPPVDGDENARIVYVHIRIPNSMRRVATVKFLFLAPAIVE
ncbi:MAG: hypothetical protein ACO1Q7_02095 [Gemmatimonas sp.]